MSQFIPFDLNIGKKKPNTLHNKNIECPFCSGKVLKNKDEVLEIRENMALIKNKFPTFKNGFQTVLIESDTCTYNLSNYNKKHLYKVIDYSIEKWEDMIESGEYKSVVLIKNHGIQSGGSIYHPHMQVIGFYDLDYQKEIQREDFIGVEIFKDEDIEVNISTYPKSEIFEFNVILSNRDKTYKLAESIQNIVHYVLNVLNVKHQSFNLAFYHFEGKIITKVIPRKPNSPLLLGYSFKQVPINLDEYSEDIKNLYYS